VKPLGSDNGILEWFELLKKCLNSNFQTKPPVQLVFGGLPNGLTGLWDKKN
jgi:hypothetical protein